MRRRRRAGRAAAAMSRLRNGVAPPSRADWKSGPMPWSGSRRRPPWPTSTSSSIARDAAIVDGPRAAAFIACGSLRAALSRQELGRLVRRSKRQRHRELRRAERIIFRRGTSNDVFPLDLSLSLPGLSGQSVLAVGVYWIARSSRAMTVKCASTTAVCSPCVERPCEPCRPMIRVDLALRSVRSPNRRQKQYAGP